MLVAGRLNCLAADTASLLATSESIDSQGQLFRTLVASARDEIVQSVESRVLKGKQEQKCQIDSILSGLLAHDKQVRPL